jgi:hypothetical protein
MDNTPYTARDDDMEGSELLYSLSPKDRAAFEEKKKEILQFPLPDKDRTWITEVQSNRFKALLMLDKGDHVLLYQTMLTGIVEFTQFRPLSFSERGWKWTKGLLDGSPGR